jgi:hypothetical protein
MHVGYYVLEESLRYDKLPTANITLGDGHVVRSAGVEGNDTGTGKEKHLCVDVGSVHRIAVRGQTIVLNW